MSQKSRKRQRHTYAEKQKSANVDKDFGKRLTSRMRANDISTEKLSEMTGLSMATIRGYMAGRAAPSRTSISLITNALGETYGHLAYGEALPDTIAISKDGIDSPTWVEIRRKMESLDDNGLKKVIAALDLEYIRCQKEAKDDENTAKETKADM